MSGFRRISHRDGDRPAPRGSPPDVRRLALGVFTDAEPDYHFEQRLTDYVNVYKHRPTGLLCKIRRNGESIGNDEIERQRDALNALTNSGQSFSPFIERFYHFFNVQHNTRLVVEYVNGASLEKLITEGKLPRNEFRDVISQLVLAIEYMHAHGVIHGYLHPTNIVRCRKTGRVVVTNFRYAKWRYNRKGEELKHNGSLVPSSSFVAPEVLNKRLAYDRMADIYSLGSLIFFMFCERPFINWNTVCPALRTPETATTRRGSRRGSSRRGAAAAPSPAEIDEARNAYDLIQRLMNVSPIQRPSFGERNLNAIKGHPFFGTQDHTYWTKVYQRYAVSQAYDTPEVLLRPTIN